MGGADALDTALCILPRLGLRCRFRRPSVAAIPEPLVDSGLQHQASPLSVRDNRGELHATAADGSTGSVQPIHVGPKEPGTVSKCKGKSHSSCL